jgi:hypothetical protein
LSKQKPITPNQALAISMFILGLVLVIISMFYVSSFLAILGVALFLGGGILLYIAPTKQVPIAMFYAEEKVSAGNIERIINESGTFLPGIYLPPGNLKNADSSIVFIPQKPKITLPSPDEITDSLNTKRKEGVLIVPPGSALSRLFEDKIGFSFTKTNLVQLQFTLPKLLVEDMEFAEKAEIQIHGDTVTVKITGSVLDEICRQTDSQPKTHKQVGCLLSSAIACALAKAVGKPITIKNETRNQETKTTVIKYQILEE